MDKNLWWGYRHISGTYQAKRYFSKLDTDEAEESPFVDKIVYQFEANSRDEALEYIEKQTSNN